MGRGITVLNVLGELRPSGAEVMLLEAVPVMRAVGVEPVVVSIGEAVGDYAVEFRSLGVPVYHVPFGRSVSFAIRLLRLFIALRADVAHVHTERANAAICTMARFVGMRVVRTIHSVFTYRAGLRLCRTWERKALRLIGVRHISVSRAVQENEVLRLHNPTTLIGNWIGDQYRPPTSAERRAVRAGLGLSSRHYVVVSVGGCSSVKNHQAILHALPSLARALQDEVVYVHVGTGSDEQQEREIAAELEGSPDVRFVGSVRDVRGFLWAADVFCMPSMYEGLGMSALEAAACGTPMVLSDTGGLRNVYEPGPAVKFEKPTADGILEGILELRRVGREALNAARLRMSDDVRRARSCAPAVEQLVNLYRGEGKSPGPVAGR